MSNMNYARFRNTLNDLADCMAYLGDDCDSDEETAARQGLPCTTPNPLPCIVRVPCPYLLCLFGLVVTPEVGERLVAEYHPGNVVGDVFAIPVSVSGHHVNQVFLAVGGEPVKSECE